jgi:hypothetical protein
VKLCMFHPLDHPMERGWVGRIDGDQVVELAAQTLQTYFTGGGAAREHAVFPLSAVQLLPPVLHPPAVRIFDDETTFSFANPAAIVGPGAEIEGASMLLPRLAAVIGADGEIGGFTGFAEWRRSGPTPPKDRDFALGLGPLVVTPDELDSAEARVRVEGTERLRGDADFDWNAARDLAARDTRLHPGDILAAPAPGEVAVVGSAVEVELSGIGVLGATVRG